MFSSFFLLQCRGSCQGREKKKRERVNMASWTEKSSGLYTLPKAFETMAAGSCSPMLTGCPLVSCAFTILVFPLRLLKTRF